MSTDDQKQASAGYAIGQLTRALEAARAHVDPEAREQAKRKARQWTAVLEGMADGTLQIGSRTPVAQTPAWVTLEVAHGGFATGRYLAEGDLREHEHATLAGLPAEVPGKTTRERLNLYYCSDAGIEVLLAALREGRYEVEVPEEAALVVVAWLLSEGHGDLALSLLSELRPLMHRLRFYPRISDQPRARAPGVHLSTAGQVVEKLRATKTSANVAAMNATLAVWNPMYDGLVSLWLQTVDGDVPRLKIGDVKPVAEGGWPCRVWPSGWTEARDAWLACYQAALREHNPTGRHHSSKSNFQRLLRCLEQCPSDAAALGDAAVASLRHSLACAVSRHGLPGDTASRAIRDEQARIAALPLHGDIAQAVANRLAQLPADEGIPALDLAAEPIKHGEHPSVAEGTPIPARFVDKAQRALLAPINELVELGVVSSSEVLALVLPQITSQIAAAGINDPSCHDLFARTYAAFRRRRSLLLLNLEHQVSLEELPWIAALQRFRADDLGTAELALQTLRSITVLAFEHFAHTIIPNPLLRELVTLAQRAGLQIPFVEEIAADIFMGSFTKKFGQAAVIASEVLEGTLYARYYDLPRWGTTEATFGQLCTARADEAGKRGHGIARNGAILEQCQILTSYNLATLVRGLGLQETLSQHGAQWAQAALRWALERQSHLPGEHLPRLRTTKNTAYAWRQAVFFLSFAAPDQQRNVVDTLAQQLAETPADTHPRLAPAVSGLRLILRGGTFDDQGKGPAGERRLLGWACGRHWMLPE